MTSKNIINIQFVIYRVAEHIYWIKFLPEKVFPEKINNIIIKPIDASVYLRDLVRSYNTSITHDLDIMILNCRELFN